MESLYVCLFSNGQIKVGRSIDPQARMATHADRVACMGVEIADTFTVACAGAAAPCEAELIGLCAAYPGATRYQDEWFSGLNFDEVCEWASVAAQRFHEVAAETPLRAYLNTLPRGSIVQFAKELGICKTQLSQLSSCWRGREPSPAMCVRIEQLSNGAVTRRDLRKDWRDIWPELANSNN
jgi:DNA-binding transcriptional regulator YdaS (Cro superfamily)